MEEKGNYQIVAIDRNLTPSVWSMIKEISPIMHQARLFGVASAEQAAAIMIKGHELGFGLGASFEFIQTVQGKPGLSPRGALAILRQSPEIEDIIITRIVDDKGAYIGHECTIKRRRFTAYTERFTLKDAERAGLIKDDSGWKKYPENMAKWRAVGFCVDVIAPDLVNGMTDLMKAPETFGPGVAFDTTGNVIEGQFSSAPLSTEGQPKKLSLTDLCNTYGAEAVMNANGGKIPGTDQEVADVARVLGGEK